MNAQYRGAWLIAPSPSRKSVLRSLLALTLVLAAAYCASVICQTRPRQIIASLLRLEHAPASLRNAECASWGWTDVLTTCAFEIDPSDFPALLTGWSFTQSPAHGASHQFSTGLKVGREFPVTAQFSILNPLAFSHGGRVLIVADAVRSRVQVDYYEE